MATFHISSCESNSLNFDTILNFLWHDLPLLLAFIIELDMWNHKWKEEAQLALKLGTLMKALPFTDKDFYPNVQTYSQLMATFHVTSCECECSISLLKLIKTPLGSTMRQDCHHDIKVKSGKLVDELAIRHQN